jgi:hypothetical protein
VGFDGDLFKRVPAAAGIQLAFFRLLAAAIFLSRAAVERVEL